MKRAHSFKMASEILSLCIFLAGLVVLAGWILDIPTLKSISPKFVTMKANTAACFILIGLSLWLSQEKRLGNRLGRGIAWFCALIVFLIGFLTFWEYMLNWDLGIDQVLFKEPVTVILTSSSGRMAFNTAINFTLIGLVLFMAGAKAVFFSYLAQLLVIPVGIISLLSFVGYLYGASPLYFGLYFSTAMAIHTTVLFIMVCMSYLFSGPEQGLMKNISSCNSGGIMMRRILPVVIFIPLFLGWFKIHGEKAGLFTNEFGISLVATLNLLVISLSAYCLSVYLNRLDTKRKNAEGELKIAYKDLKETQSQLIQSSKMSALGQLAGGVAHELNNPLTGVLNNVQLIKIEAKEKEDFKMSDFKELLDIVEASAVRCKKITQSLLDFTHIAKGKFSPVSLNEIAERTVDRVLQELKPQNITFRKELLSDLPRIQGDPQLLQQAVFGLIVNANWAIQKKSASGGVITIKTGYGPKSKDVTLTISDTGIGIPQENFPKLFTPFFTTKDVGAGTGLGLALFFNIIKSHQGRIDVESEVGIGTTFKISLPCV